MAKQDDDIASVLAFEKKLVPSDGYFYGTCWENRSQTNPLKLKEKSVRGTISNRLKAAIRKDPAKLNNEVEKPNLQTIDTCALEPTQDTLKVHFTLKVLGGIHEPSACNNANFRQSYQAAAKGYREREAFRELAHRYAINIANARYLWRNRVGAESIEVRVSALNSDNPMTWDFDAMNYSVRDFDKHRDDEKVQSLRDRIAAALSSDSDFLMLDITSYAKVGRAQDVYPSEELVFDKGKGKKGKILYAIDDIAALHSQKIGNALRTIDTWYPEFDDEISSAGPIAAEPYGAVTNLGKAFRNPTNKKDFYTFFDSWARGASLDEKDEHFVMAVLVRGGVFGESDK